MKYKNMKTHQFLQTLIPAMTYFFCFFTPIGKNLVSQPHFTSKRVVNHSTYV